MLSLARAFRITNSLCVAFVGAGGKTSAMFQMAREMAPSLVTTSTHLFEGQEKLADQHFFWLENSPIPPIESQLKAGVTLVTGPLDLETKRYHGLNPSQLEELRIISQKYSISLLIESDGSRVRPLKAPAGHEPAIPDFVDLVIVVAGLSGLNHPLNDFKVHRPETFSALSGLREGELITSTALARVLSHPQGGLKNIPPKVRKVALLNQADTIALQSQANGVGELLKPVFDAVVVSRLQPALGQVIAVKENIAAIVLAAGGSSRFGSPKQLLEYHGKPFVRFISETALQAGLSPVIVVTGAYHAQVAACLENMDLTVIENPDWRSGQSTSMIAGLGQLPQNTGGVIFLLADQPQVSIELLRALVERHSQDLPFILAPYVFDERANPLLFDQSTFGKLRTISGDSGGRQIFSSFTPRYLNWYDRRLLMDVDTPEDYQKLLSLDDKP